MLKGQDKNIWGKIREGDEKSFAKLYDLYVDKIYNFVFLKINSTPAAEEITQDVFLKVWNYARQETKEVRSPQALLYQIARNLVVDYYRKENKGEAIISLNLELETGELIDMVEGGDALKDLEIKFQMEEVEGAMRELPEPYREIIVMRYVNEMTNQEIAEALEKEETNVRVMIYRALGALRKKLTKSDEQSIDPTNK